ncbi:MULTISPECIES: formyltransferase family protein [unclassified Halorhabdus]|uniref:methionyl-tRNA formyltransferase n=1 Tax=unclassified Halorhabdus TaxID=2621901 RepID=UPI0023DAB6F1|nr:MULTISPECIES: formyltransferase family protein [unclassified Halorhabdus]WEL17236.1 Folate-dependent phosphoribosylglycinamide formyltransferase PurN [Halorhabdus sp. SVX81]WEL21118.1 Folate-dependent phosphoribosylglycinamide formyltransferase PurN [Halorhabdus sp. BNX81]
MVDVAFLGINDVGERIYDWLTERDDANILGIFTEREQLDTVRELEPELILSVGYRHIVPEDVLEIPDLGAVNLHKSYLPYNRGFNPNVWSIIEDNPAGTSLHYMTAEIDEGPIIDRQKVPVKPDDDGRDLYERLEDAQVEQFTRHWESIRDDDVDTIEQQSSEGTYHYKREFVEQWEIDPDEEVRIGDFIDRLRALTFPPYDNAYFEKDGKKYYIDISIRSAQNESEASVETKNVPTYSEEDTE